MRTNPLHLAMRFLLVAGLGATGLVRLVAAPTVPSKSEILSAYVKTSDALASDDLASAKSTAAALADRAAIADQHIIMKQASAVAKAADISAARDALKPLSASIEPLAAGEKDYVVMTCDMAKAEWVQTSTEVRNPYLGKSMLSCGELKKSDDTPGHGCGDAAPAPGHDSHAQHGCG